MLNTTKTLTALFAFSLIFVAVPTTLAQFDMKELRKSEEYFKLQKEQQKRNIRQAFDNVNFSHHWYLLANARGPEVQKAFGMTESQKKALTMIRIDGDSDSEYAKLRDELTKSSSEIRHKYGSEMQDVPQEDQIRFLELQNKMFEHSTKQVDEYMQKLFTPEQKQKFRELDISQMGRAKGPINPDMLEALGLSEEQREKMKKIQKDLAPQYEQYLDKAADWQVRLSNRIDDVVEPLTHISGSSQEEMNERMQKYFKEYSKHRQIIKDEPEFKDAIQKSDELQTAYFTALKFQMYDVLTDEQMNRLSELINNPPDYVKLAMGSDSQTSSEPPSFLNSWKPGDPIPEEYKKHRENRRRFPQKK